jgi:hypothetical protein
MLMNYGTIENHMGTYERNKKGAQGGRDIFKIIFFLNQF